MVCMGGAADAEDEDEDDDNDNKDDDDDVDGDDLAAGAAFPASAVTAPPRVLPGTLTLA